MQVTATPQGEHVIGDHNYSLYINPVVNGYRQCHGLMPRSMETHPVGCYGWAAPPSFPLYDRSEWSQRCKDKTAAKSWLSDVRMRGGPNNGMIPSRDQNGRGYCWQHSGVSCMMLLRAFAGMPYADLSAYGPACRKKSFADEGGWGAEGVDDLVNWGCPTSKTWPQQGTNRSYDNPATWAEAASYKVIGQWADMAASQYDRSLSFEQYATLWLSDVPTVDDHNFWSHSVCGMDLVEGVSYYNQMRADSGKLLTLAEFDIVWATNDPVTAGFGCRLWNSWGDSWSLNGTGILTGSKAVPDGGVAPTSVTIS